MVKTIKSSMSQARKKMLEQIKNKEESEVKRKKTTKEKYKELRESIKGPEPTPQSFSDKFEEELKKQLQEMLGDQKEDTTEQFEYTATDFYKKRDGLWDVAVTEDVLYFDPELSYELTGYRPINETQGLDFDPTPFNELAQIYDRTGSYTEYPADSKPYNDFWREQYKRCTEGYTVGKYRITGDHYFFLNFYRMEVISEGARGGAGRNEKFPTFLAKQYEFFHYVEMAERLHKDVAILKARGIGLSEIVACLAVRPYITNRGYRSLLTCAAEGKLTPLKTKCWKQLNWLDMNTNGGMRHLRQKVNNADTKRASQVTPDGVEYGWMSEIDSVIADTSDKIRGDRVDRLIYEEAGSNKYLTKSWIQGNALVELGGYHFGTRIALGCVCAGTKVWTKDGRHINIEDLKQSDGILGFHKGSCLQEDIEHINAPAEKECVRITTDYGTLECSTDHPIFKRVCRSKRVDKEGHRVRWFDYAWFRADEVITSVTQHNVIGICDKIDVWGTNSLFDPYFIGLLIGDGSYGLNKTPILSNCDKDIIDYVESKYSCFVERQRLTKTGKQYKELRIRNITQDLRNIGIYGQTKTAKRLPDCYMSLTKKDSSELLAGLFDTDGTITGTHRIGLTQSSKEILLQVQELLQKFGVYGKIYEQKPRIQENRKDKNPWYNLYIEDTVSLVNFYEEIPIKVKYKKERLKKIAKERKDSIIYKHYYKYKGIREAHVIDVERIGKKTIYNITASGTHTYLANNFITHNTGGDDMALEGLSNIFAKPEGYNVLPYKNYDTEDRKPQLTAFFIPAHKFSLREEFLDTRGVTQSEEFKKFYEEERKKLSGKDLLDYCAEHCFIPNEALYKQGENIFDSIAIADRLTQIRIFKAGLKPEYVSLLWDRSGDTPDLTKVKVISNPNSKIAIYERPLRDEDGLVLKNLYVAGIDSIDQGSGDSSTSTDVSDFCIVIKKRIYGLQEAKYVAIYKDRPRDIREAYDVAMKLLVWYNCKALLEHTKISIVTYFKEKKKDSLFMKRPASTLGDMKRGNSQMIGVPATEAIIKHGLELINNFVNDYCYSIDIDEMLEQLLKYSWENKRKFDIIAAMEMAEIADEELMNIRPAAQDKLAKEWENIGWFTNEKGYKEYGVIPQKNGTRW